MPPDARKYLEDMRQMALEIEAYVGGRTCDEFLDDPMLLRAVERCFEIIGEALTQLRRVDSTVAESFHEWRDIVSFRNVLAHGYSVIDHEVTWDIIKNDLPVLHRELDAILGTQRPQSTE